jgi:hypothetical protein
MNRKMNAVLAAALSLTAAACATNAPSAATHEDAAAAPQWETWVSAEPPAARAVPSPGPIVKVPMKQGGYRIVELCELISRETGRPIVVDESMATYKQAKVDFTSDIAVPKSELFAWFQSMLIYRKLVVVPAGPVLENGEHAWVMMEMADPSLKSRPWIVAESEVASLENNDGLYIVTSLRLRDTVDAARARNALSTISTATAGIGRVQDSGRFLIVGDFAPVVATMKRLIDRMNAETPPSAVRPAPAPSAPKGTDK